MPSTAVEVWRRIGLAGDPSAARVPEDAGWGGYTRRRGGREGRSPLPAAQGLTLAGWFDSHCHVQEEYLPGDEAGAADLEPVLARAAEAGIDAIVCIGTGAATSRQAVAVARADGRAGTVPRAWASIGLHPHEASEGVDEVAALLARELEANDGAVVAVGECGLDYYYEHSPRDAQRTAFAAQIALAHAHDLALVIHARDAWPDLFDVLRRGGRARAHRAALLHRRSRRGRAVPARRHVRLVQRDRDVQERGRRPRSRGALPARPFAGGNGQSVPRPGAASGPSQRAVVPSVRG